MGGGIHAAGWAAIRSVIAAGHPRTHRGRPPEPNRLKHPGKFDNATNLLKLLTPAEWFECAADWL